MVFTFTLPKHRNFLLENLRTTLRQQNPYATCSKNNIIFEVQKQSLKTNLNLMLNKQRAQNVCLFKLGYIIVGSVSNVSKTKLLKLIN